MIQLLKQSLRSLANRPGFSFFVIVILALCIGGNASLFSAAKAVLLQELPYKDVGRLVLLHSFYLPNATDTDLSWAESMDWAKRSRLVEKVTPFLHWQDRLLVLRDSVERIQVNFVHPQFFELLGVRMQLGRAFTEEENGAPGSAPSIIISDELWERVFARDERILGREVRVSNEVYTVVGVMPPGFRNFLEWRFPHRHDAWLPAKMFQSDPVVFESRDERYWFTLARLKPGVTLEQARQEAEAIGAQFQQEFPDSNRDYVARVDPLREYMFGELYSGMKVLLTGGVLVLLIGCANVANLLLVRMVERRRELSLRLSLGASRWNLVQQVLAESAVLAVLGGALGVLLAIWGVKLLSGLLELPPFVEVRLDGSILAATTLATLVTGLLFALPSALSVARMESKGVLQQIRAGGRNYSSSGRTGLIVFQTAIVVVLLVVAGLLLRSFWLLQSTEMGIETSDLLTLRMSFGTEQYDDRSRIPLATAEVLRRLDEVPGVEGAAVWVSSTPGLSTQFTDILPDGATSEEATFRADLHRVSPGALGLLGVPVLKGRDVTDHDTPETPRVALVSQTLAELLWPGQDPLGRQLYRPGRDNDARMTVVGVIPDTRFEGRFTEGNHDVVIPTSQSPVAAPPLLLVRTSIPESTIVPAIREVIRQVDPRIPLYDIASMDELLREEERSFRLNAVVVGLFSVLALALALLGLYSMLAYSVLQRTPEIGVRLALGADRQKVLRMVMTKGLVLVLGGLVVGIAGALILARFLSSQLYGIEERDPITFLVVVGLFALVSLLATYLPARRTLRVEPTIALRYE